MMNRLHRWFLCQQARWHFRHGLTLSRQGAYTAALTAFDRAMPHHPTPAEIWLMRGMTRWHTDDLPGAIADYTRALEIDPCSIKAYGNRGLIRYALEDTPGALADWDRALQHRPHDAKVRFNRGLLYAQQGNYQAALADLDQAIETNPNLAEAYFHRGNVRHTLGDQTGAVDDWELAICNDLGLEAAKSRLAELRRAAKDQTLTHHLQAVLAADGLQVQATYGGPQLEIQVHRDLGVGINYRTLPDRIRAALVPLQLTSVQSFKLVGRVGTQTIPEWSQVYRLYDGQPCPPTYWRLALLTALVVFPPIGIAALVYGWHVRSYYKQGDYPAAVRSSYTAKVLCTTATAIMGLLLCAGTAYFSFVQIKGWLTGPRQLEQTLSQYPSPQCEPPLAAGRVVDDSSNPRVVRLAQLPPAREQPAESEL